MFFVEAKKPSVSLKGDPAPAYQLRRYGWSAHLPISALTDFEELAIYECAQRPKPTEGAEVARVDYLSYTDYLDRIDDLYSIFSKEAIFKGAFDRYAEGAKRKRGTQTVDQEFLAGIEAWRETLAKDIARNNPDLSIYQLNAAVQSTIDRILFLRMAEDRGVERYGRLRDLADHKGIYGDLLELYREAEEKYNSGLFDFSRDGDGLAEHLDVSDKAVKGIIGGLYYPDCPYEFSVLGADILGAVYEQFLGKTIRLTPSHRAKVEEKPEVRKAGGVYYTPTYIVEYIVEHTVGELLKEAGTPQKAGELRVLDPACGSGSFLLGAYQRLLDWHLDHYVQDDPEKHAKGRNPRLVRSPSGDWRLSLAVRKEILTQNIYGVDLDRQAVEVAKLNLLLKCMEGETDQTVGAQLQLFHDRVLPNIDANIKCGNSLIGPDYWEDRQESMFDEDEARRVNPFDWEAEFPEIMGPTARDLWLVTLVTHNSRVSERMVEYGVQKGHPRLLSPAEQIEVARLLVEACTRHGLPLCAVNLLPDHVHIVTSAESEEALEQRVGRVKGSVSRSLGKALGEEKGGHLWARKFNRRRLKTPEAARNAIEHVQGNHHKHGERWGGYCSGLKPTGPESLSSGVNPGGSEPLGGGEDPTGPAPLGGVENPAGSEPLGGVENPTGPQLLSGVEDPAGPEPLQASGL
jgi:REP element-mobilizing transposase RayT